MDILILIIILVVSIGGGLLMGNIIPEKLRRKDEKHRIVRKLRSKAHQYEMVTDMAKDAKPNEIKVLKHTKQWLSDVADEGEEL